jgi:hypothetical protein
MQAFSHVDGACVDFAACVWQYGWFMTKELRTQSLLLI